MKHTWIVYFGPSHRMADCRKERSLIITALLYFAEEAKSIRVCAEPAVAETGFRLFREVGLNDLFVYVTGTYLW